MGRQSPLGATPLDRAMNQRHEAHRRQVERLPHSPENLKRSIRYNEDHAKEHLKAAEDRRKELRKAAEDRRKDAVKRAESK